MLACLELLRPSSIFLIFKACFAHNSNKFLCCKSVNAVPLYRELHLCLTNTLRCQTSWLRALYTCLEILFHVSPLNTAKTFWITSFSYRLLSASLRLIFRLWPCNVILNRLFWWKLQQWESAARLFARPESARKEPHRFIPPSSCLFSPATLIGKDPRHLEGVGGQPSNRNTVFGLKTAEGALQLERLGLGSRVRSSDWSSLEKHACLNAFPF